ncbi:MAG TPA: hypothetical protein VJ953_13115 [Saprospiraceae bacterium]|nr:hypothetical protein [Saprospiraceae bacterium]
MDWQQKLLQLKAGYQEVSYAGKRYGVRKQVFNTGKSLKLFAEELGGPDFISCNWYQTKKGDYLKPCEMPREKVICFLEDFNTF